MNRTVREYLVELERQNPIEEPTHNQDKVSTTDPDKRFDTSTRARDGNAGRSGVLTLLSRQGFHVDFAPTQNKEVISRPRPRASAVVVS